MKRWLLSLLMLMLVMGLWPAQSRADQVYVAARPEGAQVAVALGNVAVAVGWPLYPVRHVIVRPAPVVVVPAYHGHHAWRYDHGRHRCWDRRGGPHRHHGRW